MDLSFTIYHLDLLIQISIFFSFNIPNDISPGYANLNFHLSNESLVVKQIKIINSLNASVIENNIEKTISNPIINRIIYRKERNLITLKIRGGGFVGKTIYLSDNNKKIPFITSKGQSHTFVTLFPSELNNKIKEVLVSKDGNQLIIRFYLPETIKNSVLSCLVSIASTKGITSARFKIVTK